MQTLYISQQGCYVTLQQETLTVKQRETVFQQVQLPLLEQVLLFGQSQVTTQAIRACLTRNIPIVYLSQMGRCYGRLAPIEQGYRPLARRQQQLSTPKRLSIATAIVQAKLKNCRVILLRQQRRIQSEAIAPGLQRLKQLVLQVAQADSNEQLMGLEGAGAASYFSVLGACITHPDFTFTKRSRRPPTDPVNAMLSFGYQTLWNHLFSLIELQGLDPYEACLHQGSERHAALTSDLIEEFRAPMVDALVLYLINRGVMSADADFTYRQEACYLNDSGRKKYLKAFVSSMEIQVQVSPDLHQPRWDLLNRQIKAFKAVVCDPDTVYQPYSIR